jgi:hypothetical protein
MPYKCTPRATPIETHRSKSFKVYLARILEPYNQNGSCYAQLQSFV